MGAVLLTLVAMQLPSSGATSPPFPYELETGRELALTGVGLALTGTAMILANNQTPLTDSQLAALSPESVWRLERSAIANWSPASHRASNVVVYSLVAAPLTLLATDQGSREPLTLLTMYAETMLINIGLVETLKGIVGRKRPYVYSGETGADGPDRHTISALRSFPSGHTANAFAAAVFLASVFGELYPSSNGRGWVWGGSLTAAASVGYLRYRAGRHFLTDVVGGAVVGACVGFAVPKLHRLDTTQDPQTAPRMTIGFRYAF